jgi:hypothetical protein
MAVEKYCVEMEINIMHLASIRVVGHKTQEAGYVEYVLVVQGESPCMHIMCFLDLETCLPQKPPCFEVSARFSQLSLLHQQLTALHLDLPPFPPKRWLGNKSASFIEQRSAQLNSYFAALLERQELRVSSLWETAFAPVKVVAVAVVGQPGIGKIRLVEAFLNCTAENRTQHISTLEENARGSELGQVCPIDMIVNKVLVRVRALTVLQYTQDADLSAMRLLSGFDGVVLVYSEASEESYQAVAPLGARLQQPYVLAGMDSNQGSRGSGLLLRTIEDAYLVFRQLLERL